MAGALVLAATRKSAVIQGPLIYRGGQLDAAWVNDPWREYISTVYPQDRQVGHG
jgi:hypothetical protein